MENFQKEFVIAALKAGYSKEEIIKALISEKKQEEGGVSEKDSRKGETDVAKSQKQESEILAFPTYLPYWKKLTLFHQNILKEGSDFMCFTEKGAFFDRKIHTGEYMIKQENGVKYHVFEYIDADEDNAKLEIVFLNEKTLTKRGWECEMEDYAYIKDINDVIDPNFDMKFFDINGNSFVSHSTNSNISLKRSGLYEGNTKILNYIPFMRYDDNNLVLFRTLWGTSKIYISRQHQINQPSISYIRTETRGMVAQIITEFSSLNYEMIQRKGGSGPFIEVEEKENLLLRFRNIINLEDYYLCKSNIKKMRASLDKIGANYDKSMFEPLVKQDMRILEMKVKEVFNLSEGESLICDKFLKDIAICQAQKLDKMFPSYTKGLCVCVKEDYLFDEEFLGKYFGCINNRQRGLWHIIQFDKVKEACLFLMLYIRKPIDENIVFTKNTTLINAINTRSDGKRDDSQNGTDIEMMISKFIKIFTVGLIILFFLIKCIS